MNSELISLLIFLALAAVVIGSAVTYQGNPKGKKWRAFIPLSTYPILGLGTPAILGVLTGLGSIDVETSRQIMIGATIVIIGICAYFTYKYW